MRVFVVVNNPSPTELNYVCMTSSYIAPYLYIPLSALQCRPISLQACGLHRASRSTSLPPSSCHSRFYGITHCFHKCCQIIFELVFLVLSSIRWHASKVSSWLIMGFLSDAIYPQYRPFRPGLTSDISGKIPDKPRSLVAALLFSFGGILLQKNLLISRDL